MVDELISSNTIHPTQPNQLTCKEECAHLVGEPDSRDNYLVAAQLQTLIRSKCRRRQGVLELLVGASANSS